MPEEFQRCVDKGGKVRTKSLPDNKFIRISYLGESFPKEKSCWIV